MNHNSPRQKVFPQFLASSFNQFCMHITLEFLRRSVFAKFTLYTLSSLVFILCSLSFTWNRSFKVLFFIPCFANFKHIKAVPTLLRINKFQGKLQMPLLNHLSYPQTQAWTEQVLKEGVVEVLTQTLLCAWRKMNSLKDS